MSSEKLTAQQVRDIEETEAAMQASRPGPTTRRGEDARQWLEQKRQAAKKQSITIRLDADIVDRFKKLAGDDGSYQRLLNQAAREWLDGNDMEATMRRVMREVLDAQAREAEDAQKAS